MTKQEFLQLPSDGRKWELIAETARGSLTGCREAAVRALIVHLLHQHTRHKDGLTCGLAGFQMVNGNIRCPDVSFTRKERLPDGKAPDGFGRFAPDLCVEIISPSEEPGEMREKVEEYFASGAVLVWHVFPETEQVIVFTSPTEPTLLEASETLNAGDVLPGFSCRVSDLFDVD